jgi:hypothetical protein
MEAKKAKRAKETKKKLFASFALFAFFASILIIPSQNHLQKWIDSPQNPNTERTGINEVYLKSLREDKTST